MLLEDPDQVAGLRQRRDRLGYDVDHPGVPHPGTRHRVVGEQVKPDARVALRPIENVLADRGDLPGRDRDGPLADSGDPAPTRRRRHGRAT